MHDLLIRIEMRDFDAWLKTHYEHAADRRAYGIEDGPVYRDIDNPNAALFHIRFEDEGRAMERFRTEKFREASRRATVTGREFYFGQKRSPGTSVGNA